MNLDCDITPQEIKEMKEFLQAHPIDPAWDKEDEMLDGVLPKDELEARMCRDILKDLGELD